MTLSCRFTIALRLIAAGIVAGAASYQRSPVNVSRGDLAKGRQNWPGVLAK
jgi:hypothetical protein